MTAAEPSPRPRIEPRWPVVLSILAVLFLLVKMPDRVRCFPSWVAYVAAIVVVAPMAAVTLTRGKPAWLRVERWVILLFFLGDAAAAFAILADLIQAMVHRSSEVHGLQLLTSSIGVWINNVLMFALLYWQMDRGGPEARMNGSGQRPDWQFPQSAAGDDAPPDWRPTFVDYLFLGFSTATAFSPTDALPLTSRAKLLMMLQSTISLVTIVVVASRAINILGS
jgi:hypothetical protein